MEQKAAKRFYKEVSCQAQPEGYEVYLDSRSLKTPAKQPLLLPNEAVAKAVRDEFDAQQDEIKPETMPVFSLASTVIDRVMTQRSTLDAEMVRYGLNDLISYHATAEEDPDLAEKQAAKWGAINHWLQAEYDVQFAVFTGIMPQSQPPEIEAKLSKIVMPLDMWRYVALYRAATLSGSFALGLAFHDKHIDVDALMQLSFLDEYHQEEKWGADEWAIERRDNIQREYEDAWHFLGLLD